MEREGRVHMRACVWGGCWWCGCCYLDDISRGARLARVWMGEHMHHTLRGVGVIHNLACGDSMSHRAEHLDGGF